MKRLVLISDINQVQRLKGFLDNSIIIATNPKLGITLKKQGINVKPVEKLPMVEHFFEGKKFIQNWIKKNKKFSAIFNYEGMNIFDILEYNLIIHSDYFYSIGDILQTINLLKSILSEERPDEIVAVDDGGLATEIIKKISQPKLIKTERISYKKEKLTLVLAHNLLKLKLFYRKIKPSFRKNNPQGKIITLAAGLPYVLPILPLIKFMKQEFILIKPLQFKKNEAISILKKENIPFTHIEDFLDKNTINLIQYHTNRIQENLKILSKNEKFISSFVYKGVPIFDIVNKTFEDLFNKRGKILEMVTNVILYKKLLEQIRPKLIMLVEEENLHSRVLLKLSQLFKIPVLYTQHGFLSSKMVRNEFFSDKMLVWSNFFKKGLLTYNNHNKEDIIVTGRMFEKNIFPKLNLPKDKKIITLATNLATNKELILETLKITKELKDVQLVIKLHPSETGKLQKKLAKLTKTKPLIIKNTDIRELMSASNLVITTFSTIGIDALECYKPLIIDESSGVDQDDYDYIKSGAAIGVKTVKDLQKAVKSVLYKEKVKEKLAKNAKSYVKKYLSNNEDSLQKTIRVVNEFISS